MKNLYLLLLAGITAVLLTGCAVGESGAEQEEDRLKIVCTIFPAYDWVKQILGDEADGAELTLLMKNGTDMHSYQPTVWDMTKIAKADLFIYVGGESDFWVGDALENTKNPERKELNLMELLENSVKEEEHVDGMKKSRGHEEHEEKEEAPEYDEHVWLSLRNAENVCSRITDLLCELDDIHAAVYEENSVAYQTKLHALDEAYCETAASVSRPVLLFGDRFPFRYLTDDYDLTYYAAFAGCSAETEASFYTIAYLAEKADELSLPTVLTIDGSDQSVANTIAGSTKIRSQKVLMLDSMQSVSERDIKSGETYLAIMERNLSVLKEALKQSDNQGVEQ